MLDRDYLQEGDLEEGAMTCVSRLREVADVYQSGAS
jgi:hypothetical protein